MAQVAAGSQQCRLEAIGKTSSALTVANVTSQVLLHGLAAHETADVSTDITACLLGYRNRDSTTARGLWLAVGRTGIGRSVW